MASPPTEAPRRVSRFRRYLPQILATMAKNLLLLDLGLSFSIVTIIMPAVRGINDKIDKIQLNNDEATTMAALGFVGQPLGSFLSGWLTEPLGRRPALFWVNVPHVMAWVLMSLSTTKWHLYTSVVLMGFGNGIMEAPVMTYVAEIAEPSIRGVLLTLAVWTAMLGYFVVYLMGALIEWRTAAAICIICPVLAMIAIFFVPETPYWLLARGRQADAVNSLCWLRGWVHPDAIAVEMQELKQTFEQKQHPPSLTTEPCRQQLRNILQPATVRPFLLMVVLFFGIQFGGYSSLRPYMVQVFATMDFPLRAHWATVGVAVFGTIGAMLCTLSIMWLGKRRIYLVTAAFDVLCLSLLAIQAGSLPAGTNSFNKPLPPLKAHSTAMEWTAMLAMFGLAMSSALGIYTITFNLLAEIFPYRTRGIATGIACCVNYMLGFAVSKSFYIFEKGLTLCGLFCLYAVVTTLCCAFAYFYIPDTENRTLLEVEELYAKSVAPTGKANAV